MAWGAGAAGGAVSEQAHPGGGAVPRRGIRRPDRPHAGDGAGAPVRPAHHRGQQARRGRQHRLRAGGPRRPDGHTLLMGTIGTHAINGHLYRKLAFDPLKSFEPVAFLADAESVLVVGPAAPVNSVGEFIKLAKAKPGSVTYASAGSGSTGHLAGELFEDRAGVFLVHIPYRGNAPALNDVMAGQVAASFATLQTALPFIQGGRLKAVAVLGQKRSALLPQVPTLAESGLKNFEVRNWTGLLAPAGTPAPVVNQLQADISRFMLQPETQARLAKQALTYLDMKPKEFAGFIQRESDKWGQVIRAVGVTAD
nr:tripartite tricarboxylate transporter substrate-binding protein [Paenacidovorax monticola]